MFNEFFLAKIPEKFLRVLSEWPYQLRVLNHGTLERPEYRQ